MLSSVVTSLLHARSTHLDQHQLENAVRAHLSFLLFLLKKGKVCAQKLSHQVRFCPFFSLSVSRHSEYVCVNACTLLILKSTRSLNLTIAGWIEHSFWNIWRSIHIWQGQHFTLRAEAQWHPKDLGCPCCGQAAVWIKSPGNGKPPSQPVADACLFAHRAVLRVHFGKFCCHPNLLWTWTGLVLARWPD